MSSRTLVTYESCEQEGTSPEYERSEILRDFPNRIRENIRPVLALLPPANDASAIPWRETALRRVLSHEQATHVR